LAQAQPELGKWWKNSEMVKSLKLSEAQVNQIEQTFVHRRPALASLKALMKADPIDESKILSQTELVAVS
jgi:Spy/CpxP family protein refolding chaperone